MKCTQRHKRFPENRTEKENVNKTTENPARQVAQVQVKRVIQTLPKKNYRQRGIVTYNVRSHYQLREVGDG